MANDLTSENERRMLDILSVFSEVEQHDPRLMIVIAGSRVDASIERIMPDLTSSNAGRRPGRCYGRINLARRSGRIDHAFHRYADALRLLRNVIVHRPTTRSSIHEGQPWHYAGVMHDCTRQVPIWSDQPTPADDFGRCMFASCVAGVMAAELEFADEEGDPLPMSFEPLAIESTGPKWQPLPPDDNTGGPHR